MTNDLYGTRPAAGRQELAVGVGADGLFLQSPAAQIPHWGMSLEVDGTRRLMPAPHPGDVVRSDGGLAWTWSVPGTAVEWAVTAMLDDAGLSIDSMITNRGRSPVRLGKAVLVDAPSVGLGAESDEIVLLPVVPPGRQYTYRLPDPALPTLSKTVLQVLNSTSGSAVRLGFLTFQRANTEITYAAAAGGLAGLSAYCDYEGWQLEPGRSTPTETFQLVVGVDPVAQMQTWADEAAELIGVQVWPEAPIGYVGGAWADPINGARNYEDVTLENLDAINARLGGFDVRYLWTSMSNVEGSTPGKWLEWNLQGIPSGREKFLHEVTSRGFRPGFWIGPFYLCSGLPELMDRFQDAILTNLDGSPMIVCPEWRHGDAGLIPRMDRPVLYALDPTHPKVLEYVREVFETYREWGVRYYMVDFLEAGAGSVGRFPYAGHFDESVVAGPEAYTAFLRELKDAAGEDTYLLSSTGPTHHNAGLVDGVRVGNDYGEGRPMSPEAFFYPASFVINDLEFETGPQYALVNWAANFHTHRRLYLNDSANLLSVDRPIPLSHARVAATIHALSGGGTMLGDDIRDISDERLSLIKKTLPRVQDIAQPVDLFTSPYPVGPRTFWRRVDAASGRFDVIAAYNLGKEPARFELDLARIGLAPEQNYLVWDFWNEAFLGYASGTLSTWVEREAVQVLRMTPANGVPTVIGTDLHVLMGEAEIDEARYDPDTMTLHLAAHRPPGERGTVFVWAPDHVRVLEFDGLHIAKDSRDNSLVIAVPLEFGPDGRAAREIGFAELDQVLDMGELDLA